MFRLDQFMRVTDDVQLPNGETVSMRVLSEIESNARHDYGLSEAMRVSEDLKRPDSELYRVKVAPIKDATLDSVLEVLAQGRLQELSREAQDLYRIDFAVPREDATLQENIQTEMNQKRQEAEVYEARAKYIIKGIQDYRAKASELPREQLEREIEYRAQQVYSKLASQDAELYYTLWRSVEKNGKPYWDSPETVQKLPPAIVTFLQKKYTELDAIDPWEVTKSVSQGISGSVGENRSDHE